jgi:hypothetical protein
MDFTSKWLPRTFPIRGKYDDYGGVKLLELGTVMERLWVSGLQADMYELGIGANSSHDIAVHRGMDFSGMWDAQWEERLLVPGFGGDLRRVTLEATKPSELPTGSNRAVHVRAAFIRSDVWELAMGTWTRSWKGEVETFGDIHEYVRDYWAICNEMLESAVDTSGMTDRKKVLELHSEGKTIQAVRETIRRAGAFHPMGREHHLGDVLKDELPTGWGTHWLMALEGGVQEGELDGFLYEVAEAVWMTCVCAYRNVLWQPSETGGQDRPWAEWMKYHRDMVGLLASLMVRDEVDDSPLGQEEPSSSVPVYPHGVSPREVLEEVQDLLTVQEFRRSGLSQSEAVTAQTVAREVVERLEGRVHDPIKVAPEFRGIRLPEAFVLDLYRKVAPGTVKLPHEGYQWFEAWALAIGWKVLNWDEDSAYLERSRVTLPTPSCHG